MASQADLLLKCHKKNNAAMDDLEKQVAQVNKVPKLFEIVIWYQSMIFYATR